MSCSNCYNGCTEIVSDRCVKYTGIDVPILEIKTGDSLSYVEQALIQFLVSTLDGSGIKITLPQTAYCDVVTKYLPTCGDVTALTLFEALVKAACDLQEQIDDIDATLTTLNADYTIGCLSGVTASSDTHAIVQAIITKLCQIDVTLTALSINVNTNYVKIADINTYIAAYIASTGTSTKYYTKMVPYVAVEFYPTPAILANFSGSGVGSGDWEKIYFCNGSNGTPDKRGVVPVGLTDGQMGGGTMNSKVNPATPGGFNPTYSLGGGIIGDNSVTLTVGSMPSHTHTATVNLVDPGHTHDYAGVDGASGGGDSTRESIPTTRTTQSSTTGITVSVTNSQEGFGLPHQNNQPALACYYIIYLP
jgi:microcystin-dependent protein